MYRFVTLAWRPALRSSIKSTSRAFALLVIAMQIVMAALGLPGVTSSAAAAAALPAIDAALAARVSDQVHKDWNADAELIQIRATTTGDGAADGSAASTPVSFLFRANGRGYQVTISSYGSFVGAPAVLPRTTIAAVPIDFISLKDALALARAKGFSQTGDLHPVLQSQTSTDGLQKIGWLFGEPGDPLNKQIFVGADGHQVGSVQQLFGSLRQ